MANWTTVSAGSIKNLNNTTLASGTLVFQATDANNVPVSFQVGGGGQILRTPFSAAITNGAVTSFSVPDPANTNPAGILYRVTVISAQGIVLEYRLVSFTGTTFNLDNYAPSGAAVVPPTGGTVVGNVAITGNLSVTGNITYNELAAASVKLTEGTAPSGEAGKDILYGDSTAHRVKVKNNNGAAQTLATLEAANAWTLAQTFSSSATFSSAMNIDAGVAVGSGSVLTPAQITANQNDYAPGITGKTMLRIATDASRDITGLAGWTTGQKITVINVGAFDAVLKNASGSSTASNQFLLGADVTLNANESIMLWYDSTSSRWRALGRHN